MNKITKDKFKVIIPKIVYIVNDFEEVKKLCKKYKDIGITIIRIKEEK